MALTFTGLEGSTSSTDSSIYTTGTVQPGSGGLVLAAILSRRGSGDPGQAALTGNGITWVEEDTVLISSNRRLTLLRGLVAAPTSGTISINFSGTTQTHCSWAIGYFAGADTSGTNGSGAIVQNPTATTGTGEATALTLDKHSISEFEPNQVSPALNRQMSPAESAPTPSFLPLKLAQGETAVPSPVVSFPLDEEK